ncbi:MAG: hypothetical protein IPK80_26670 [Nannocystis sp.]|nr:hypothetical protein [Nannocystis sp.]
MASPIEFQESGVTFRLDPETACRLDELPKQRLAGLMTCEFVMLHTMNNRPALVFVEAKSSLPHQQRSPEQHRVWIDDIATKFTQSIALWLGVAAGRHDPRIADFLPSRLKDPATVGLPIHLLLIIPTAPDDKLPDISASFNAPLHRIRTAIGRVETLRAVNYRLATRLRVAAEA